MNQPEPGDSAEAWEATNFYCNDCHGYFCNERYCSRELGHNGDHAATEGDKVIAVWPTAADGKTRAALRIQALALAAALAECERADSYYRQTGQNA